MKKNLLFLFIPFLLVACGNENKVEEKNKTNYGIAPIFNDPLGVNDKDPSILLEGEKEYIFYTSNRTKFTSDDAIYMRSGEKNEKGEMIYETGKNVLTPSENGWDSVRVSNPSVLKGEYHYQETSYQYIMAYQGTSKVKDKLYQIGFAVSNDLYTWTKVGDEPMISYSSYAYGSAYGVGAPSLVSYDQKGKFYCFYTYADALITTTRVQYFDASSLETIQTGEPSAVSSIGLEDKSGSVVFNNADFMIDSTTNTLYCVRDRNPVMTLPATSDSVQVAKADLRILTNPNDYTWELIARGISDLDTADMDGDENQQFGWERIFSPCFISSSYHQIEAPTSLEIAFTVSATGVGAENNDYLYSSAIVRYEVLL